ncbi:MAG: type II toxin-antitoxin system VapC family toxin [Gemmatimonadetes bacterium]|nr:type II toxin-antitoxin system VapC family toxin [Gemmatimonadota bacterium]
MLLIVDTSVVIAVVTNEPHKTDLVRHTRNVGLLAPASLPWEVGNAFSAMLRRERITQDEALRALAEYRRIPIQLVDVSLEAALKLAGRFGVYAYDAYMIACAFDHRCPLITLDAKLKGAAQEAGVL